MTRFLYETWNSFKEVDHGSRITTGETHVPIDDDGLYFVGFSNIRPADITINAAFKVVKLPGYEQITAFYRFDRIYDRVVYNMDGKQHELRDKFNGFAVRAANSHGEISDTFSALAVRQADYEQGRLVRPIPDDVSSSIAVALDLPLSFKVF